MDTIINVIDIVLLVSTICRYNIAQLIIKPWLHVQFIACNLLHAIYCMQFVAGVLK